MRFRTSLSLTLLLLLLALVFSRLGLWQLERKVQKEALFARFVNAPSMELRQALEAAIPFTRVRGTGRFDGTRHLLQDNRMYQGRPGVHVLTPFDYGEQEQILINRGWLPMAADRRSLPAVPTEESMQEISGRMVPLAATGPRLGAADVFVKNKWPQLFTYLDRQPVSAALGTPLADWIILLDGDHPGGFDGRDWQPATMKPAVHAGYALQWFSMSAAAIIIWLILGFHKGSREQGGVEEKQ